VEDAHEVASSQVLTLMAGADAACDAGTPPLRAAVVLALLQSQACPAACNATPAPGVVGPGELRAGAATCPTADSRLIALLESAAGARASSKLLVPLQAVARLVAKAWFPPLAAAAAEASAEQGCACVSSLRSPLLLDWAAGTVPGAGEGAAADCEPWPSLSASVAAILPQWSASPRLGQAPGIAAEACGSLASLGRRLRRYDADARHRLAARLTAGATRSSLAAARAAVAPRPLVAVDSATVRYTAQFQRFLVPGRPVVLAGTPFVRALPCSPPGLERLRNATGDGMAVGAGGTIAGEEAGDDGRAADLDDVSATPSAVRRLAAECGGDVTDTWRRLASLERRALRLASRRLSSGPAADDDDDDDGDDDDDDDDGFGGECLPLVALAGVRTDLF